MSKKIKIITPLSTQTIIGNQITALRIRRLLKQLGHKVSLHQTYEGDGCEVLIALHALRSGESIHHFKAKYPLYPVVVVLTGTDLYHDIKIHPLAQSSLEIADRIVILQQMGLKELPERFHHKTRVIYQSAQKVTRQIPLSNTEFNVCVIANIRAEKDPFLTSKATRLLPKSSHIKVTHIGGILAKEMEELMVEEVATNPRYEWVGTLSYHKTRRVLANSHLLVITSQLEGSSNVLAEAIASRIPVIWTRISGLIGTLGVDYAGYFNVGDIEQLAILLQTIELDTVFYNKLKAQCAEVAYLVDPKNERQAWHNLVEELIY